MKTYREIASLFDMASHETRLRILDSLPCNGCAVESLWKKLGVSQPTMCSHLALLRASGLVLSHRQGKQKIHQLTSLGMRVLKCVRYLEMNPDFHSLFNWGDDPARDDGPIEGQVYDTPPPSPNGHAKPLSMTPDAVRKRAAREKARLAKGGG